MYGPVHRYRPRTPLLRLFCSVEIYALKKALTTDFPQTRIYFRRIKKCDDVTDVNIESGCFFACVGIMHNNFYHIEAMVHPNYYIHGVPRLTEIYRSVEDHIHIESVNVRLLIFP
mmetsp:Transcript_27534/g.46210  ORF Transcript_27534/g.46210 Transcript_27534/m.46210 type:complete len:115 (-) Transcript_27534:17-361(-)